MSIVSVCRFSSLDDTPKPRNYRELKARALEVGRFSVFEATQNNTWAKLMTRLCHDPEIETFDLGFPWTGVRPAPKPAPTCPLCDDGVPSVFDDVLFHYAHIDAEQPGKLRMCEQPWRERKT